jgi:hypothetical protein
MSDEDLMKMIQEAITKCPAPTKMVTDRKQRRGGGSQPAKLADTDGTDWWVKSPRLAEKQKRTAAADLFCGLIGKAINAPVSEVGVVELPKELVDGDPKALGYLKAGTCHGSKAVSEKEMDQIWIRPDYKDKPENRPRYAAIAVLYGLLDAGDSQLHYDPDTRIVYTLDHGDFLPGSFNWNEKKITDAPDAAKPYARAISEFQITEEELRVALVDLKSMSVQQVVDAAARVPASWGITESERLALVKLVLRRQAAMTAGIAVNEQNIANEAGAVPPEA